MDLSGIIGDAELHHELMDKALRASGRRTRALVFPDATTLSRSEEAIILRQGRPVLFVRKSSFEAPHSEVWAARLETARTALQAMLPSVGRVDVKHYPRGDWLGTAWLVADDVLVTNRHVADEFAWRDGETLRFREGPYGKLISARIDFRAEHLEPDEVEVKIRSVLYMEPDPGPDFALLQTEAGATRGLTPIPLTHPVAHEHVAVVGYPARDGQRNDPEQMNAIFGDVYDVKRLAPGDVTEVTPTRLMHDCSTLGGNSGSCVFSLERGAAVGLHFGGRFLTSNWAVPAPLIANRLELLGIRPQTQRGAR